MRACCMLYVTISWLGVLVKADWKDSPILKSKAEGDPEVVSESVRVVENRLHEESVQGSKSTRKYVDEPPIAEPRIIVPTDFDREISGLRIPHKGDVPKRLKFDDDDDEAEESNEENSEEVDDSEEDDRSIGLGGFRDKESDEGDDDNSGEDDDDKYDDDSEETGKKYDDDKDKDDDDDEVGLRDDKRYGGRQRFEDGRRYNVKNRYEDGFRLGTKYKDGLKYDDTQYKDGLKFGTRYNGGIRFDDDKRYEVGNNFEGDRRYKDKKRYEDGRKYKDGKLYEDDRSFEDDRRPEDDRRHKNKIKFDGDIYYDDSHNDEKEKGVKNEYNKVNNEYDEYDTPGNIIYDAAQDSEEDQRKRPPYVVNYEVTEEIPYERKPPKPQGPVYPRPPPCPGAPPPTFPTTEAPAPSTKAPPHKVVPTSKFFEGPHIDDLPAIPPIPYFDSYFPTSYMSQSHSSQSEVLFEPHDRLGPPAEPLIPSPELGDVPHSHRFPRRASPQRVIIRYQRPTYVIRKVQSIGPAPDAVIIRHAPPPPPPIRPRPVIPRVKEVHIHHHHDPPSPVIHVHKNDENDYEEDAKFEAEINTKQFLTSVLTDKEKSGPFAEPPQTSTKKKIIKPTGIKHIHTS